MKKASCLLFAIGITVALAGCNIGKKEAREIPAQVLDETKYQEQTEEGIYLGIFNSKFVDIEVDGEVRMFSLPKKLKKEVEKIKNESRVSFTYAYTKNSEYELRDIESIDSNTVKKNITKDNVEDLDKQEEKETEKDEKDGEELTVTYDGINEKKKANEKNGNGFELLVLDDYELQGNQLIKNGTTAKLEFDVNKEIQKERWRAAGELKQHGELKEIKNNGTEFTFYTVTNNEYREISVKNVNGKLVRVSTVTPLNEKDKNQSEINAMVGTLK